MNKPPPIPHDIRQRVSVFQMIWFALIFGLVSINVSLWFVREQQQAEIAEKKPPVAVGQGEHKAHDHDHGHGDAHSHVEDFEIPLAAGFAGVALLLLILSFVIPGQVGAKMSATFESYQGLKLAQGAMLEGGGVLQAIGYLNAGQWWSLAVAGLLVLVMFAVMPTRDQATRWIQRHSHR